VLLRDGDVFGMANSLEIRVPMLDRDLVEWAFQLPGRALLPPGAPPKHLLQQMCGDLYTRSQFAQGKRGFSPPFGRWLLKPLRGLMEENLKSVKASGLVDGDGVDAVKRVFLREPHSQAWSRAWVLVTLGHWLAKHKSTAV
jgi:asparagine synthase (glutamine-hydrolysing)